MLAKMFNILQVLVES